MNGSIRCARCTGRIPTGGVCPKCSAKKGEPIAPPVSVWIYSIQTHRNERISTDQHGRKLDYKEAYKLLRQLRGAIDKARDKGREFDLTPYLPPEKNPNTCDQLLTDYLTEIEAEVSPGTFLNYSSTVNVHLRPYFGSKDVRTVDINEIKLFMRTLKDRRKGTTKTVRNRLSAFLHWAWEKKKIEAVPPLPRVHGKDEQKKVAFSLSQQLQAVEKLQNPVIRNAVLLMMLTGMRVSEALVLKVSDVSLKDRSVTVRRTWSGHKIKESTKTDEPRTIPLSYLARDLLTRAIGDRAGSVWLFPRQRAQEWPYHRKDVSRAWHDTGAGVTLRDATRRSFATICKDAGMDLRKIQELLGHKELRTTEIYLKDEPLRLVDELDRVQGKVIDLNQNLNGTLTSK
jgi:integrase/recombinase XerC